MDCASMGLGIRSLFFWGQIDLGLSLYRRVQRWWLRVEVISTSSCVGAGVDVVDDCSTCLPACV